MRVLYDDHGFRQPFGGVPKCFVEIMRRLPDDVQFEIAAKTTVNAFLRMPPFNIPHSIVLDFLRFVGIGRFRYLRRLNAANDRLFRRLVSSGRYDLVHLTEPHYHGEGWKSIPDDLALVVTVHDLIPELIWKREDVFAARARVLARADRVIAVSEYTRCRTVELYPDVADRITVIHHGCFQGPIVDAPSPYLGKNYLLYVGARYDYKNFPWFLRAVRPLLREDRSLAVVCTGVPFTEAELRMLADLDLVGQVIQTSPSDGQMPALYAHARAFVHPSRMEGFGIPTLDAFSFGCPVVLAENSCQPEIGGDAALYFRDGDDDGLRRQLVALMRDQALRRDMIRRGRARAQLFSWEETARRTCEAYRLAVERRKRCR